MGALLGTGKIKEWGVSNETSFGVCTIMHACERLGVKKPITIQNDFGLLYRSYESELAETTVSGGSGRSSRHPTLVTKNDAKAGSAKPRG